MKRVLPNLILLALCACSARQDSTSAPTPQVLMPENAFDKEAAMDTLTSFLEISPRNSGTSNALAAAEFIRDELKKHASDARIDSFEDPTPAGPMTFHNVIGTIGQDASRIIILASHFDTKSGVAPDFQGANDSGSSTAAVLELARIIGTSPPPDATVVFAFFDGEECMKSYGPQDGLHGSRHMAGSLKTMFPDAEVLGMILLDMIGDRDLMITVPANSTPRLRKAAFDAAHRQGTRDSIRLLKSGIIDDHVPFLDAGYPAIDLIDFEFGSKPSLNDYWHTHEDSIDKVSADSMAVAGNLAIGLANELLKQSRSTRSK